MQSKLMKYLSGLVAILGVVFVLEGRSFAFTLIETGPVDGDTTTNNPVDIVVEGTVRGSIRLGVAAVGIAIPQFIGASGLKYTFTANAKGNVIAAQTAQMPDYAIYDALTNRTVYAYKTAVAVSASAQSNPNYTVTQKETTLVATTPQRTYTAAKAVAEASLTTRDTSTWTVVGRQEKAVTAFRDAQNSGTAEVCGADFPQDPNQNFLCTDRDPNMDQAVGIAMIPGTDRNNNVIVGGVTYTVTAQPN